MRRVVSLFLPHLAIERLRRLERPAPSQPERTPLQLPVDDDPGACSVPRGGGWRPGARWARGMPSREEVEAQIASLPHHAQPPGRELGRRSEAASHPFKRPVGNVAAQTLSTSTVALRPPIVFHAPLALLDKVGRREEVVAACPAAMALGIHVGMAATHARALVSDLDFRPAEPLADAALLDRLALFAVRRWTPIAAVSPPDGLWIDLTGCDHLHGGEARFCRRLLAFGEVHHAEFLALDGDDPRPACAAALAKLPVGGAVIAWNAAFERSCLLQLAEHVPAHADALRSLAARLVDLLPVSRRHYYHRDMRGSWSIKAVLPTLAPELDYKNLDGVRSGMEAQELFTEALMPDSSAMRREAIRRELLAYCERDTLAMVIVLERLRGEGMNIRVQSGDAQSI